MSTSPEARGGTSSASNTSSTYFVHERSSKEEIQRLQVQDQMMTSSMGGVLPEQPDPTIFQQVLDVGCGTGGWLIGAAKTYPTISRAVGIDINDRMIEYASAQAQEQQVADRVEFRTMDAMRVLQLPSASFDLVNQRLGQSYLRKWDWPGLLSEFRRVARPSGVIRLTESISVLDMNSPALAQLAKLSFQALYNAGHSFAAEGVTDELVHMLHQYASVPQVQTKTYTLEYHAGTPGGQQYYENIKHMYRVLLPFIRKWTLVPDDYEEIYQQALREVQRPDFVARWSLLTVWGSASS
ncbi:MAG: hypothetical protein NVSMB44_35210 [Ktedonobacteraceae bacterium]